MVFSELSTIALPMSTKRCLLYRPSTMNTDVYRNNFVITDLFGSIAYGRYTCKTNLNRCMWSDQWRIHGRDDRGNHPPPRGYNGRQILKIVSFRPGSGVDLLSFFIWKPNIYLLGNVIKYGNMSPIPNLPVRSLENVCHHFYVIIMEAIIHNEKFRWPGFKNFRMKRKWRGKN